MRVYLQSWRGGSDNIRSLRCPSDLGIAGINDPIHKPFAGYGPAWGEDEFFSKVGLLRTHAQTVVDSGEEVILIAPAVQLADALWLFDFEIHGDSNRSNCLASNRYLLRRVAFESAYYSDDSYRRVTVPELLAFPPGENAGGQIKIRLCRCTSNGDFSPSFAHIGTDADIPSYTIFYLVAYYLLLPRKIQSWVRQIIETIMTSLTTSHGRSGVVRAWSTRHLEMQTERMSEDMITLIKSLTDAAQRLKRSKADECQSGLVASVRRGLESSADALVQARNTGGFKPEILAQMANALADCTPDCERNEENNDEHAPDQETYEGEPGGMPN